MAFPNEVIDAAIKETPNLCLSGGAAGADLAWGYECLQIGYGVIHWSFAGFKSYIEEQRDHIFTIRKPELEAADEFCLRANDTLGRTFPTRDIKSQNLLRRSYYQIERANSVYAISTIKSGQVSGGTAWATQMFIDRCWGAACNAFVFDQEVLSWYKWNGKFWEKCGKPRKPRGIFAGIGTRQLNFDGRAAITEVLN